MSVALPQPPKNDDPPESLVVPLWSYLHTRLPRRPGWRDATGVGWFIVHYDQVDTDRILAVHCRRIDRRGFPYIQTIATWHATGVTCWPCITGTYG